MFKAFSIKAIATAIMLGGLANSANALSLDTGDFTGWLSRVYSVGNTSSTISFPASGGNPDAHVQITNFSQQFVSNVVIAGILSPVAVVTSTGTWASSFSIDFDTNENPGGDHHAIGLLAEQDSRLYWTSFGVTGVSSGWATFGPEAFSLEGSDFSQLTGTTTALDLTQPFFAGFATGNSRSGSRGSAYDNLVLGGLAPVPLPASLLLLGGALAGLGAMRARRRTTA